MTLKTHGQFYISADVLGPIEQIAFGVTDEVFGGLLAEFDAIVPRSPRTPVKYIQSSASSSIYSLTFRVMSRGLVDQSVL